MPGNILINDSSKRKIAVPVDGENPLLIAMVGGDGFQKYTLRDRLEVLGHFPIEFGSFIDFLSKPGVNSKFDCIIFTADDEGLVDDQLGFINNLHPPLLFLASEYRLSVILKERRPLLSSGITDFSLFSCADEELNWKLRMLALRRVTAHAHTEIFIWGDYRLDARKRSVWHKEKFISLKPQEFRLAHFFFQNMNSLITRKELLLVLWPGSKDRLVSRKIDVCVSNVRKKLDLKRENGLQLNSVYGLGYELVQIT